MNAYVTGTVTISGNGEDIESIRAMVDDLSTRPDGQVRSGSDPEDALTHIGRITHAGSDEAGKGDYFGPLITAAVLVEPSILGDLRAAGVRDSKSLNETTIERIAEEIRQIVPHQYRRVVPLSPLRYNMFFHKVRNLNRILGWAHARALEDVVVAHPACKVALADQFGDPRYIEKGLVRRGRQVELVQMPRAERDTAVAAASILARHEFIIQMRILSARYDVRFPLGASNVEDFARELVAQRGPSVLLDTSKTHFQTTTRVVSETVLRGLLEELEGRTRQDAHFGQDML